MAPPGGGGSGGGGGGGLNPDIIRSLTELLGSSNTNLERMLENLGRLGASSQSLTGLAGSAQELADHLGGLGRSLTDLQKLLGKVNNESKKQSSILKGLGSSWKVFAAAAKGAMGILGGLTDVISTVGGALWDLGAAIIAVPFDMLNWLVKKSKEVLRGGTEIANAYEKIREQFGDLTKSTAKDVIDFGKSMATGMITPTLSARRVFGSLAEAMDQALEVAAEAPATFQLLSDQFEENGLQIMAMAKGLGIGKEELTALQQRAVATGTSLVDLESEITKYAKGMSAQFGLNSKAMSRDMGRAMKDVKHFANSTIKEIAQATTYAHKLGLELKDITGVLDKFNTFDEAAENVSKLSQAFGINVDAMKLVEAKTPAEALDMLKQAMNAAGKSADQMNRHELQLLASTVGMSEEQVRMAFSMKNSGVSMDKVKQAGTGLEHQMMNTAEAVAAVADDIKRMVKEGQEVKGESFFEIFGEGFLMGIDTSKEFLSLLMAVKKDIYIVRDAGIQLGRAFVANFPGVKDFIDGLKQMLNPTAIKGLMSNVVGTFKDFFKQLQDGTADVGKLFDSLINGFTNFAEKTSGGSQMMKGLKNIWKAVERIISTGIDWLADKLKSGLEFVVKLLSGDFNKAIGGVSDTIGDAIGGGATAVVNSPIAKSFISMFEKLVPQLEKIFDLLWKKVTDKLGKFLLEYKWEIALVAFGPSVMKMFISGVKGALSNPAVLSMLTNPITLAVTAAVGGVGAAIYQGVQLAKDLRQISQDRQDSSLAIVAAEKNLNENYKRNTGEIQRQIGLLRQRAKDSQDPEEQKKATAEAARLERERENERLRRIEKAREAALQLQGNLDSLAKSYDVAGDALAMSAAQKLGGAKALAKAQDISNSIGRNLLRGASMMGASELIGEDITKLADPGRAAAAMQTQISALVENYQTGITSGIPEVEREAKVMMEKGVGSMKDALTSAEKESSQKFLQEYKPFDIATMTIEEFQSKGLSMRQAAYIKAASALAEGPGLAAASAAKSAAEKADAERKKEAEAAAQKQASLEAARAEALEASGLGTTFTLQNAEEAIKKVDELAKQVLSPSFDLEKTMKQIREKFAKIDFTIFATKEEQTKVQDAALDLKFVSDIFVGIANVADNMQNIPKAAEKLKQLPENATSYQESVKKVGTILFGADGKSGGVVTELIKIEDSAKNYKDKIENAKNYINSIQTSVEGIAKDVEKIMDSLPKLSRGGGLPNVLTMIDKLAKSSDSLKGPYEAGIDIFDKTREAMEAAASVVDGVSEQIEPLVGATSKSSKYLTDNIIRSVDATANRIDQLFISLEKITNAIARPIGAKSPQELGSKVKAMVDAINQLNAAMTDIKIGENGEVNVKMNNLAKGINKADQKYTIEKKNAVINLTVSVSMSVTDVESMLIKNPNSLIRARINDALGPQKLAVDASGAGTTAVGAG